MGGDQMKDSDNGSTGFNGMGMSMSSFQNANRFIRYSNYAVLRYFTKRFNYVYYSVITVMRHFNGERSKPYF